MILSPEQTRALNDLHRWCGGSFYDARPFFILAGYAGTGKTTLIQHFINEQSEPVRCLAPTGKAASVLQRKLKNAIVSTVHSALYKPVAPSTARLISLEAELLRHPDNQELQEAIAIERKRLTRNDVNFSLKVDKQIAPGQLVVVDEASMVTKRMLKDLIDTRARVIFVGDPGQLPPVMDEGFFQKYLPDAMLETVQRQALDSPIICASMKIRNGEKIERCDAGAFRVMPKSTVPYPDWLGFDQVITGSNASRRRINVYFRRRKFEKPSWWPMDTDKLICLNNENDDGLYYINGVQAVALSDCSYDMDNDLQGKILYESVPVTVSFYRYPFQAHYDPEAQETPKQMLFGTGLKQFDYAYAITVHKSQGSEWDRVLIADDRMQESNREFRKRWLYTAVTRARKEVLWVY